MVSCFVKWILSRTRSSKAVTRKQKCKNILIVLKWDPLLIAPPNQRVRPCWYKLAEFCSCLTWRFMGTVLYVARIYPNFRRSLEIFKHWGTCFDSKWKQLSTQPWWTRISKHIWKRPVRKTHFDPLIHSEDIGQICFSGLDLRRCHMELLLGPHNLFLLRCKG